MRLFSHPIKKLTLFAAFSGGYVLGAKAGRERYEQIREAANQVKDDPRVQQAAQRAEDRVREAATKVTEDPRIKDVVARAEEIIRDAGLHPSGGDDAGPAPTDVSPLLKDEHVETQDEVVYSTGPDIEETIDELADLAEPDDITQRPTEQPGDHRGDA